MLLFHGHDVNGHQSTRYSVMTAQSHQVRIVRSGSGTIASGLGAGSGALRDDVSTGLTCPTGTCGTTVLAGTTIWLYPRPAKGYRFVGWTGCNGARPAGYPPPRPDVKAKLCWVSATTNVTVRARFARLG